MTSNNAVRFIHKEKQVIEIEHQKSELTVLTERLSADMKKMELLLFTKEKQLKQLDVHCQELEKENTAQKSELSVCEAEMEVKKNKVLLLEENVSQLRDENTVLRNKLKLERQNDDRIETQTKTVEKVTDLLDRRIQLITNGIC